jgi:Protein of unknown function (DUF2971)
MRRAYIARASNNAAASAQLQSIPCTTLGDRIINAARSEFKAQQAEFLKNKGISCFSEVHDNLLMWAHYADSYRGFCMEFRTDIDAFQKLEQVQYVPEMPEISLVPFICNQDPSPWIEAAYLTKHHSWAYEREWRAIHSQVGTLYSYPAEALKTVYFGSRIDAQEIDLICIILCAQNPHVQLRVGTLNSDGFRIEFEPKTYTPLALAQRYGSHVQDTLLYYPNH